MSESDERAPKILRAGEQTTLQQVVNSGIIESDSIMLEEDQINEMITNLFAAGSKEVINLLLKSEPYVTIHQKDGINVHFGPFKIKLPSFEDLKKAYLLADHNEEQAFLDMEYEPDGWL